MNNGTKHGQFGPLEMTKRTFEDLADEVRFLGRRRVGGPPSMRRRHLPIGDQSLRMLFQSIDPRISYPIRELLLLSPQNRLREIRLPAW